MHTFTAMENMNSEYCINLCIRGVFKFFLMNYDPSLYCACNPIYTLSLNLLFNHIFTFVTIKACNLYRSFKYT